MRSKEKVWSEIFLVIIGIIIFTLLIVSIVFYLLNKDICCGGRDIKTNLERYNQNRPTMNFSSQCLGVCRDYAIGIVHVPRTNEDNLVEDRCEAFRNGEVSHFIELDKNGNIVRIV